MSDSLDTFIAGAALLVSVFAMFFAARKQTQTARSQSALSIYHDYLKMCVEYPTYASYQAASRMEGFPSLAKLEKAGAVESERYLWFVSFMLSACENIICSEDFDEDWERAIIAQLEYHAEPLQRLWADHWEHHYSEHLRRVMFKVPGVGSRLHMLEAAE